MPRECGKPVFEYSDFTITVNLRRREMKIKKGANIQGLNIKMRRVLVAADKIWGELGQELVITSGLEGEHSAGSLHYYGRAVDMRTRYFDNATKKLAHRTLSDELDDRYNIIVHPSHIHVEYDPDERSQMEQLADIILAQYT